MVMRSRNNGEDADDTMATRNETLPMRETEGTSREVSLVISGIRTLKQEEEEEEEDEKEELLSMYHAPVNKHKVSPLKASNKNETFKMKFLRVKVEECTLVNEVHGSGNVSVKTILLSKRNDLSELEQKNRIAYRCTDLYEYSRFKEAGFENKRRAEGSGPRSAGVVTSPKNEYEQGKKATASATTSKVGIR
uniref:Uncharacterized protein n=1 Tax=Vespula pensylvanica TaxID=30213 RepID=A0A834UBF2_VESPE|nr:hypothetical protein H0235_007301 [Vespula pensylvanica]